MIHHIAEGSRTTSRRTKDVEAEPGEQGAVVPVHTATAMPADSCADLTEDTDAGSDSDAGCTARTEGDTATTRRGPLQTPTPSQAVIAAARARAKKMNRGETNKERVQAATGENGEGNNDSNDSSLDRSGSYSNSAVK